MFTCRGRESHGGRCVGHEYVCTDFWTVLNRRLLLCVIISWTLATFCTTSQPYVNTLLMANDVELNPGPTLEEQLSALSISINEQFADLRGTISTLACSVQGIQTAITSVREDIAAVKAHVEELERQQQTLQLDIDANHDNNEVLQSRVTEIEETIEKQEQYSRRENILLHGLPEQANENYTTVRRTVVDLLNSTVKTKSWSDTDIVRAHRLGRASRDDRPRPIIVRFTHFMDKLSVLKARQELRTRDVGVSNDHTARQREALERLRAKGQRGYYKNGKLVVVPAATTDEMDTSGQPHHRHFISAHRRPRQ